MYSDKSLINRFTDSWAHRPLFRTTVMLFTLAVIHALFLYNKAPGFGLTDWLSVWINLLNEYAGAGILALGMTFVITSGGVDLSSGAMPAVIGAVIALFAGAGGIAHAFGLNGLPAYAAAICAGLIFGALLGLFTGILITRGNIPPFLATLGTMMIYRGFSRRIMDSAAPVIPRGFQNIALFEISGKAFLPIIYWLVLAAALHVLLNRTVFGKSVAAVGSNENAAWLAGINVKRIKRLVYMLAGILAAVTSVIRISAANTPDYANAGGGYAADAIAACIFGGARLGGGRGYIAGAVMGAMIIAVINNMSGLMGVSPYMGEAFRGAVIIAAVLLQGKKIM